MATLLRTVDAHRSDVNCCRFAAGRLASCSSDKTVRLWDTDTWGELTYSPLCGHTYNVHCCVFNRAHTELATCSTDSTVIIWSMDDGSVLSKFDFPASKSVRSIEFSRSGKRLIAGGLDGMLAVLDLRTSKFSCYIDTAHEGTINTCCYTPCDQYVISGSSSGDIRSWLERDLRPVALGTQSGHDIGVLSCVFSPNFSSSELVHGIRCHLMASVGNDPVVRLWTITTFPVFSIVLRCLLQVHTGPVHCCCFSSNGSLLATGSVDKTVCLWNPIIGEHLYTIPAHKRYINTCTFSEDGSMLATGSNDKSIKIWSISAELSNTQGICYVESRPTAASTNQPSFLTATKPVSEWTIDDVSTWLDRNQLKSFSCQFQQNHIDGPLLLVLTDDNLKDDLKIESIGHRHRLISSIQTLRHRDQPDAGIPEEFLCPITRECMQDPVVASDGYSYEREAIESWLASGKYRSPLTNSPLSNNTLVRNQVLRIIIQRHINNNVVETREGMANPTAPLLL